MPRPERPVIDAALARRLVDGQFPQWASLPITPVAVGGWDNRTFHLGDRMSIRLPSAAYYVDQVAKEHRWLPRLAPSLPRAIPTPLALGAPGEGYPWPWSVYGWLEGETVAASRQVDRARLAADLAAFLAALRGIDPTGAPPPGAHNFHRGGALSVYDAETRRAVEVLGDRIDASAVTEVWEAALASAWAGRPVWTHGDVAPGNLLLQEGRLSAVIDFGCSAVGDPACDLAMAWTFFSGESREVFRAATPLDPGTWARGRGWTLWKALIVWAALPGTNPLDAETSQRIIDDLLADHARFG